MDGFATKHARRARFVLGLVGLAAAIAVPGAAAGDFEGDNGPCFETPGNAALLRCPSAYVGVPYQVAIATDPDSGCYPYIIIQIVNSALPEGLSMTKSGVISGVPTSAGLTRFWLWNHDWTADQGGPAWCARDDVSQREFSIPVEPALAIANAAVRGGTVGQPYSDTLTAKRLVSLNPTTFGADVAVAWSVQSGALPPGVTLSENGLLAGTPTAEGSYQFVVKADLKNDTPPATHAFTLVVGHAMTVQSPPASTGEVGVRFTRTLTASGGSGKYTWSVSSGALPPGVALDAATGTISGTPHTAGSYQFVATATDSEGRVASTNASLRVVTKLAIRTSRLAVATAAHAYRAKLVVRGGVQPLKWRVVRGKLPVGTTLSAKRGMLTGAPRSAGSFRVTIEARDALGAKSRKTFVLRVVGNA